MLWSQVQIINTLLWVVVGLLGILGSMIVYIWTAQTKKWKELEIRAEHRQNASTTAHVEIVRRLSVLEANQESMAERLEHIEARLDQLPLRRR